MGLGVGQVPSVLALHRRRALQVSPLQTVCKQVIKLFRSPLVASRVHGWLASRAASACAESLAAHACGAACKHSCKQFADKCCRVMTLL